MSNNVVKICVYNHRSQMRNTMMISVTKSEDGDQM